MCFSTKLLLIKVSIIPEFTSTCINKDSDVLVISKVIDRYSNIFQTLRVLMAGYKAFFLLNILNKQERVYIEQINRYIYRVTEIIIIFFY